MQFSDVIGQSGIKNKLVELVQNNRLSHALLFLGKEGYGALPLALSFAQYVVCETVNGKSKHAMGSSLFDDDLSQAPSAPSFYKDSCGTCAACTKSNQLVHPDIHFSYPVSYQKSRDSTN